MASPYTVSAGNSATPPTAMQRSKVATSSAVTRAWPIVTRSRPARSGWVTALGRAARARPRPAPARAPAPAATRTAPPRPAPYRVQARRHPTRGRTAARATGSRARAPSHSSSRTYGRFATTRSYSPGRRRPSVDVESESSRVGTRDVDRCRTTHPTRSPPGPAARRLQRERHGPRPRAHLVHAGALGQRRAPPPPAARSPAAGSAPGGPPRARSAGSPCARGCTPPARAHATAPNALRDQPRGARRQRLIGVGHERRPVHPERICDQHLRVKRGVSQPAAVRAGTAASRTSLTDVRTRPWPRACGASRRPRGWR